MTLEKFMARYQHLPLYQEAYGFSREIYRLKLKLPKDLKHDLGSLTFQATLRCIRCIVFANGLKIKQKPLQTLLLEIEMLWSYLRLLHDLRGISRGEFQVLTERLESISKQAQAWQKWEMKLHARNPVV